MILVLFVVAASYLLLFPVPITPAVWTPPSAPTLTGVYAAKRSPGFNPTTVLGDGRNPEDVALDAEGRIFAGFEDGRIIQLQPDGTKPVVFANTQGRPWEWSSISPEI